MAVACGGAGVPVVSGVALAALQPTCTQHAIVNEPMQGRKARTAADTRASRALTLATPGRRLHNRRCSWQEAALRNWSMITGLSCWTGTQQKRPAQAGKEKEVTHINLSMQGAKSAGLHFFGTGLGPGGLGSLSRASSSPFLLYSSIIFCNATRKKPSMWAMLNKFVVHCGSSIC